MGQHGPQKPGEHIDSHRELKHDSATAPAPETHVVRRRPSQTHGGASTSLDSLREGARGDAAADGPLGRKASAAAAAARGAHNTSTTPRRIRR